MNKSPITIAIQTAMYTAIAGSALAFAPATFAADAENEVAKPAAQTAPAEEVKKAEADEKITVTGSRLRRDSFSVATPLVTMDRESIGDTGLGDLANILTENMPAISFSTSNSTSQSSVSATGLQTVELRNMGSSRTLTLIDGRRVVGNSKANNSVSMSTIPAGMIERIETITGGASATYGSDAVAGVVNIITQSQKEGFSAKTRAGETTDGGGKEFTLDLNYGSSFADERGYMFMSVNYDKDFGLKYSDRDRAAIQSGYFYDKETMRNMADVESGEVPLHETTMADWRSLSDGIAGGVFLESKGKFWYDGTELRNDWNEERDGVNSREFVQLTVPSERVSAAIKVDFDITDDVTFYSQVQWSGNYTVNDKSPEDSYEKERGTYTDRVTGLPGNVYLGKIAGDNPFIPQEILDFSGGKSLDWDRRFYEVGPVSTDNDRETVRAWAGLQGVIFDGDWDWDVSVGYGTFNQTQARNNEINVFKAKSALDAGYAADGSIQCNDAAARADGCVALNLFGEGSITTEMADYIRVNPTLKVKNEQTTIMGHMAGDLFTMPAGPVATAFGFEYRKDSQEAITDEALTYGGITWNLIPAFKGDITVAEVFAEASFPLLRDLPGVEHLSLETSLRFADYDLSAVGLVTSSKLGFLWSVGEGLNLRGNWAVAQRAPTVNDIFEPAAGDFDGFADICDNVTATSTAQGHDNCRLDPSIAAAIAADGKFEDEDPRASKYSPNAGNPELFEETGTTATIGATYEPTFLGGFSIAVDYYDIFIEDAISSYSNYEIQEQCYASSITLGDANEFCDVIKRDADGQIDEVLQRSYNIDETSSRGIDIAVVYKYDLNEFGALNFGLNWTHLLEHSTTKTSVEGVATKEDYVGFVGTFEDKAAANISWSLDDLRIRWSTSYKSAALRSTTNVTTWEANIARCAEDDPEVAGCITDPEKIAFQEYASYIKHNISASYNIELQDDASVRIFGGMNNVFDDKGQFYVGGRGNYGSEYDSGRGRFVYLGAEVKF
ncbi:MAG: TonB-dependent receptor [Colwellia sp.]|nr:TonB-dependent receptor [Colwellia sp.]